MNNNWKDFVENMTFSFSNLNSFNTCKYCWFKNYAMGIRSKESNPFADYGTLMHKVFELLDREYINKPMAMDMCDEGMSEIDLPMAFGHDLNLSYKKSSYEAIKKYKPNDHVIGLEVSVDFKVGKYRFKGFIDKVVQEDNGDIIIIDHKSKSSFSSKTELKRYARQLYLYSIPLKEKYGKYPKELQFNLFRKDKVEKIPFNLDDLEEAKQWAISTIEEMCNTEIFCPTIDEFLKTNLCDNREDIEHQEGIPIYLKDYYPKTIWRKKRD